MVVFIKYLNFCKSFILLLLCFLEIKSYQSENHLYKGYKTLWEPYTQWHPTERIRRRNASASRLKTSRVVINVNKIPFYMKDDYDIDDLPPPGIRKTTLLNIYNTAKQPNFHDSFIRAPQWNQDSESQFHWLTTRKRTWRRPTGWKTPDPRKTLIWAWTTTKGSRRKPFWYHNDEYGDTFYGYLRRNRAKVGGKTLHRNPLPTASRIFGTTNIWRFWSYDQKSGDIGTFLALETEEQSLRRARSQRSSKVENNTYCYVCGLDEEGIPRMPSCYALFDGPYPSSVYERNKHKRKCIATGGSRKKRSSSDDDDVPLIVIDSEESEEATTIESEEVATTESEVPITESEDVTTKESQELLNKSKRNWYGNLYRGGCFKRYTDIGIEYNERGCRTMKPVRGKSFASKRFSELEKLLFDKDDGCVSSPFASLTPFSRPIYLYVRYHVCVCKGRYCNRAVFVAHTNLMEILSCIFVWTALRYYLEI